MVDAVDRALDLLAADPEYRFLLDGQAVVVEDYLAVRPERRDELTQAVRDGRMAVGPWFVQPDTLLPAGESHVRNLLLGRRAAAEVGGASTVGYLPDCFGHPAHMPQILAGFGLRPFVYWRQRRRDRPDRPSLALGRARWHRRRRRAPGRRVFRRGRDRHRSAGGGPARRGRRPPGRARPVLLMNGADHSFPKATPGPWRRRWPRRRGHRPPSGPRRLRRRAVERRSAGVER